MSSASEPTAGAARPLVDTAAAAQQLNVSSGRLEQWALAGILKPARTDLDGTRWWDQRDLRRRLAPYLDDHDEDHPR